MTNTTRTATQRLAEQSLPTDETLARMTPSPPATAPVKVGREPVSGRLQAAREPADQTYTVRPLRWQLVVAASAATAVVAIGGMMTGLQSQSQSPRQTPAALQVTPLPPEETLITELADLANRAATQPPQPGSGRFQYVHTTSYTLATARTTNGRLLRSGEERVDRETWIAADGSGRILQSRPSNPAAKIDEIVPTGGFQSRPVEVASAKQLINVLTAGADGRSGGQWLEVVRQIWLTQVVPPELQNALLTILSTQPDVGLKGPTTDRAGRAGVAVSADNRTVAPAEQLVLVFDIKSGALLDAEQVVLENSDLAAVAPATVNYTQWINSGYTPAVTSRP